MSLQLLENGSWDHSQSSSASSGASWLYTLLISSARIHICGSYTVLGEIGHWLPCNYNYSKMARGTIQKVIAQCMESLYYIEGEFSLIAFIFAEVTLFWVKSAIGCDVITITRKWLVGPFPIFFSIIWCLLAIYTVNFICSHSYLRKLHCFG